MDFTTYINMALCALKAGSAGFLFSAISGIIAEHFYEKKRSKMFNKPRPWDGTDWAISFVATNLIFLLVMAVSVVALIGLTIAEYVF